MHFPFEAQFFCTVGFMKLGPWKRKSKKKNHLFILCTLTQTGFLSNMTVRNKNKQTNKQTKQKQNKQANKLVTMTWSTSF